MAHRENDNRGDDLHRQNESFLRDRIKALEARVKELEDRLDQSPEELCGAILPPDKRDLVSFFDPCNKPYRHGGDHNNGEVSWARVRGGWGNG